MVIESAGTLPDDVELINPAPERYRTSYDLIFKILITKHTI